MAKKFIRKPDLEGIQAAGIAAGFGIGNGNDRGRGWDKKTEAKD
ncbi:hypothetical protein D1AOALGA4SA_7735 [Olavius algarvensis Delta 1 endosymbiont]|nr:hypothetical protein D1AOALGA4SA_7735 [Olavius algarvensis Delta 1 endosymbiont]